MKRTPAGEAATRLFADLIRVRNLLSVTGDRVVEKVGLTSARWSILREIAEAHETHPVASLARILGTQRQTVQRIVNDLREDGLVTFKANPHHRQAQLVALTDKGKRTLNAAWRLQVPEANKIASRTTVKELESAHRVIVVLRKELEAWRERNMRS